MRRNILLVPILLTVTFSMHQILTSAEGPKFEQIFDGKSLDGWKGDPTYWRAEDGILIGEITPDTLLKQNSWIIWQGGTVADFELKLEYRMSDRGNSGIGYRCDPVPGQPYTVRGYQADIDGANDYTGINYEERGRKLLALRGMKTLILPSKYPSVVTVFSDPAGLKKHIRNGDWNEYHIYIRGGLFQHFINGVLMSEVNDKDLANGNHEGLLGVQVHVGPPMKIEYRNIRLKQYPVSDKTSPDPKTPKTPKTDFDHRKSFEHVMKQLKEHLADK